MKKKKVESIIDRLADKTRSVKEFFVSLIKNIISYIKRKLSLLEKIRLLQEENCSLRMFKDRASILAVTKFIPDEHMRHMPNNFDALRYVEDSMIHELHDLVKLAAVTHIERDLSRCGRVVKKTITVIKND